MSLRLGLLRYERIGHLAVNTETYLRKRATRIAGTGGISVFFSDAPANEQLLAMVRRRVWVVQSRWAVRLYNHVILPAIAGTPFHEPLPFHSNDYAEFNSAGPQLSFTRNEDERGRRLLSEMGVPPGAAFVCFHSRDKAYLDKEQGHRNRSEWSYQDFRDCSIENYLPAAEWLASQGIYAIRMGSVVERPLSTANERIIDYATKHRSDFGDVWLSGRCKFFLGNDAGLICVPACLGRPTAVANYCPLYFAWWAKDDVFIPKLYRKSGRVLTIREVIALGADHWMHVHKFAEAGIEVVENSADDVLDLARELNARLDGTWIPGADDEKLQRAYRDAFPPDHPSRGFPSRVGAGFLRRHQELLS